MTLDFSALLGATIEAPAPETYRARDGSRLDFRRYAPTPPRDPAIALILLHGSGSHSRYLAPLGRAIAAAGVAEVYTPDLRGHGPHPVRRGDIDYTDQLEDDLADLIEHVRTRSPAAAIAIGGHSSGGGLALRFAGGRYGKQAAGFVLLAPFLRHDAPTTRADAGGWARPKVPLIAALSVLNGLGVHAFDHLVAIEFEMPEALRDGTETLAYSHRLNRGYAPRDYRADLASIHVPLLVLVGADDEAFRAPQYAPVVRAHAPRAEVRTLSGQSHLGLVVAEAVRAPLIEWLGRLRPALP